MAIRGDLRLEIDELGLEVRVTIQPDAGGAELSPEVLQTVLTSKKVRFGIDDEAIERAFRSLNRSKAEPVSFVAAVGTPPQETTPDRVSFENLPVPSRLAERARIALEKAGPPRPYRIKEVKLKREKKVLRKAAIPFLPSKESVEVVVEKRLVKEPASVDLAVTALGYATHGRVVARIEPGKQGREGKSVFGRSIPAARPDQEGFLFCDGLERVGAEVRASSSGFLRRGAAWCELVPYRDHEIKVEPSADRLTCLLTITPGEPGTPAPEAYEILEAATRLGFATKTLLPEPQIDTLIRAAMSGGAPLARKPITRAEDGSVEVTVAGDRLSATLTVRKGRGAGKQITLAEVGQAIRASKVAGFNAEALRRDLQAFFAGTQNELTNHPLVTGRPPKPGKEARVEWVAEFLSEAETRQRLVMMDASRLAKIPSLDAFPLEKVDAMAEVTAGAPVLRVSAGIAGTPGMDVFGIAIPAAKAGTPQVRLFEGLVMKRDEVLTTVPGVLDRSTEGTTILLRVRPHRDAELRVALSEDRMKATVTYLPPAGDGSTIAPDEVRSLIQRAGVARGIDEAQLLQVMDHVKGQKPLADFEVARGKLPAADVEDRVTFHAHLATGKASAVRRDGSMDYKAQDRISSVEKGELIATLLPLISEQADGWDLTGALKPVSAEVRLGLQAGRGVRADKDLEGTTRFYAERAGELSREGSVLSVHESYTIRGDVDMSTGNVDFPGLVHVGGSIRSGFKVAAGQSLDVAQAVEAALVSAANTVTIGAGVKGEGKAILRAGTDLSATFAEQATLVAAGNITLRESCVLCQVTCGGKLTLETERGSLVGGRVRAYKGVSVQNIGSVVGVHTLVQFGEDFLLQEKYAREQRIMEAIQKKLTELDGVLRQIAKTAEAAKGPAGQSSSAGATGAAAAAATLPRNLHELQTQRRSLLKRLDEMKVALAAMHEKLKEVVPAEVAVRGTLFPGSILECRGKRYEVATPKNLITLRFDAKQGKIVEAL